MSRPRPRPTGRPKRSLPPALTAPAPTTAEPDRTAAALLGSRAGLAGAALERLTAEKGRLEVMDWAGYGNDGGQSMFAQYVQAHPHNKPQFSYMANESDALAKIRAGQKPDLFRPYV